MIEIDLPTSIDYSTTGNAIIQWCVATGLIPGESGYMWHRYRTHTNINLVDLYTSKCFKKYFDL